MRQDLPRVAFNRGLVSPKGLARGDIKRIALGAATHVNWIPSVLGSMTLRPGLEYIESVLSHNPVRMVPFVFAIGDTALLEFTEGFLRVLVDDELITRLSVSSAVTNGTFDTDLASWTDNDESGAASEWVTGGYMGLAGDGTNAAIRDQVVTVAAGDQGVEHALRIVIERGPVILRVGNNSTIDNLIRETTLGTGVHSLSFSPNSDFNIRFMSRLLRQVLVDSVAVESSGVMSVPTPYVESDLDLIRTEQSGDVVFVAVKDVQQQKIERRSTTSWSVVRFQSEDGPFQIPNTSGVTLTASALSGNITVQASARIFRSTHGPSADSDGAIFEITSKGQTVERDITGENQWTDPIRVTGVDNARIFVETREGTFVATVNLQRSFTSEDGPWEIYGAGSSATGESSVDDALDNVIAWYRLGVATGNYTSGTVEASMNYQNGSITGIARVTEYVNATEVTAEVLVSLGGVDATDDWAEGAWSDFRGWPSAVAIYDGRLWWAGHDNIWGSVSDAYASNDIETEGDSGPIARSIGSGPVDTINWLLPLDRLAVGGQGAEFTVRSSALDEPVTPTNFQMKPGSRQGSAGVSAVAVDEDGIFVQRGGTRIYDLTLGDKSFNYASSHLSAIVPEIGQPEIVRIAVQRQPDTRVHFVRSDGTVAMLVFDRVEKVICWLEVESDGASGEIEDVCVLPGDVGDEEDQVYYVVKRSINGSDVRYLEKWALESQCIGANLSRLADSFVVYNGAATTSITGLTHLEGQDVVVWADGEDVGYDDDDELIYTVSGGAITLTSAASRVVVGLPYTAQWKSTKLLELVTQIGPGKTHKNIKGLGLILANVHAKGLRFGRNFTSMDDMPSVEEGAAVDADAIRTAYDTETIVFPGDWDIDSRLCLEGKAPRPVTVMAAICEVEFHG